MAELTIRSATTEDAQLLSELGAQTFLETFAADNTPANMDEYLAQSFSPAKQTAELSDPKCWVKIGESEGKAVGYAMMRAGDAPSDITGESPVELVRLYVSRECIGSGVGGALMKDCLSEAAERGYETVWLGVWEHNYRAQAFYRKWNFIEVGTHIFQLGDDPQRDLLMCRTSDLHIK